MAQFRTAPLPPVPPPSNSGPPDSPPSFPPSDQRPTTPRPTWAAHEDHPLSHRPTETDPRSPAQRAAAAGRTALTGRVLAGKYELSVRLGVGGMGEVYRASHLSLGIEVAVKIMHPEVAVVDEYMRRFRREAHAASLLHHRNIVRVLDFGEQEGLLYIVMELLRGETVSRWLARSLLPPSLEEVVEIVTQVLDAFEAAHAAGIVHRDLKPENVFLTVEADGKRIAKVVDFGLAHVDDYRDAGPTLTKQDLVSGTPEYMSPEQCRSLQVGTSTDIYAIGCLLTELLQLAPPFMGNAVEVMTQQMFVPPPALRRPPECPPVPPLLERLRLSLLAKHPEQRPQTIGEVRRLLSEAMSPEATNQRLPSRKADVGFGRGELSAPMRTAPPGPTEIPISIHRLSSREDGLTRSTTTGLAAQGFLCLEGAPEQGPSSEQGPSPLAIVLDAGSDEAAAARWLGARPAGPPVIVCLEDVTTERMNTLIAAGAKDIVPYPVTSDVLAKKLRRATRSR